jgi:hypothetical protein
VRARLAEFTSERLRKGLECLLDPNPNERKKIFQVWGIENKEEHFLEPILAQKEDASSNSPIAKITRQDAYPVNLTQLHPSASQLPQHGLKVVPSEAVIVPSLSIQNTGRVP